MSTAAHIKEVLHHPIYSALSSLPFPLPQTFVKWQVGGSPFSTHSEVVSALAVYLAVIFGGQWLMRDRKPFRKSARRVRRTGCGRELVGGDWGRLFVGEGGGTCSASHRSSIGTGTVGGAVKLGRDVGGMIVGRKVVIAAGEGVFGNKVTGASGQPSCRPDRSSARLTNHRR